MRTRDQHREASDRRRLYGLLAGEQVGDIPNDILEAYIGRRLASDRKITIDGLLTWAKPAVKPAPKPTKATFEDPLPFKVKQRAELLMLDEGFTRKHQLFDYLVNQEYDRRQERAVAKLGERR